MGRDLVVELEGLEEVQPDWIGEIQGSLRGRDRVSKKWD